MDAKGSQVPTDQRFETPGEITRTSEPSVVRHHTHRLVALALAFWTEDCLFLPLDGGGVLMLRHPHLHGTGAAVGVRVVRNGCRLEGLRKESI